MHATASPQHAPPATLPHPAPARSFRLTGGSKFGADFLLYPGDPTLYHAQFCVRLLPFRQPILPAMLASATRGSHQARKHLLVASVVMGEAEVAAEEAAEAAAAKETAAAGGGQAAAPAGERQQQKQQGEQGEQPPGDGPEPQEAAGPPALAERLGACVTGVGAGGERYRIHYMTIGPVEGFGG